MEEQAISILERHGIMSVATVRPDGWPQATIVGYVNEGLILYFLISRSSQKYTNLAENSRVSITVASQPGGPKTIEGLSMAANVAEVRDEPYRSDFLSKLSARHPGYFDQAKLNFKYSALMRAVPRIVSVVDFSQGLGHAESMTVGVDQITEGTPTKPNNWGPQPAHLGALET